MSTAGVRWSNKYVDLLMVNTSQRLTVNHKHIDIDDFLFLWRRCVEEIIAPDGANKGSVRQLDETGNRLRTNRR